MKSLKPSLFSNFAGGVTPLLVVSLLAPQAAMATGWAPNSLNDPNGFNAAWHPTRYTYKLQELNRYTTGKVKNDHIPWADSYWPMQRGGMAYRWLEYQREDMDQDMTMEQRQKLFFDIKRYPRSELRALQRSNPEQYKRIVATLSPLEKYALLTSRRNDEHYYNSGMLKEFIKSSNAQRQYWEGYCHAWAAASSHYTEPMPVVRTTVDGLEIPFYTADVKALLVANYQQKTSNTFGGAIGRFLDKSKRAQVRFVGKRCENSFIYPVTKIKNGKEVFADYGDTHGLSNADYQNYVRKFHADALRLNYRLKFGPDVAASNFWEQTKANMDSCENTNAGAFHIVMVNQLGIMNEGFLFDKTRDAEVWNQPAYRYTTEVKPYVDASGSAPSRLSTSAPGTVSVAHVKTKLYYADDSDYGWAFANPTLLAMFNVEGGLAKLVEGFKSEYARYSKLLMKEGDETEELKYPSGIMDAAQYEYTLDLDAQGNVIGGDWISFDRPDYMWIMKHEPFAFDFKDLGMVYEPVQFPMGQEPNLGDL